MLWCSASLTWLYFPVTDMGMLGSDRGITKKSHTPTWPLFPPVSLWIQHSDLHQRGTHFPYSSSADWQERNNGESSALYRNRSCGWIRDPRRNTNGRWQLLWDASHLLKALVVFQTFTGVFLCIAFILIYFEFFNAIYLYIYIYI